MPTVREAEIVSAQIQKYGKLYSKFEAYYHDITWRLARDPDMGNRIGALIPGFDYPTYLIETAAMRPLGIPKVRVIYSIHNDITEILSLAVYEAK